MPTESGIEKFSNIFFMLYQTPDELAKHTPIAASTWRNRAAAGQIPGAIKKGKTWLIPNPAHANYMAALIDLIFKPLA
jgi:hypothetical protein